jgi:uncharacterized protein YndB with AHSA1/START domain
MTSDDDRSIDLDIEVTGTPEEVWRAIATGPGITAWFVPAEVEEREGGTVRHDFGEMGSDTGRVLAWEPPRRVVMEGSASNGGVLAFEWQVEAKTGDTCVVRLVTTGFGPGEEWDADFDGLSGGWPLFLENLRLHLTHFAGRPATVALPMAMRAGDNERAWGELCATFGLPPSAAEGDEVTAALPGGETWSARVTRTTRTETVRHAALLFGAVAATGLLAVEGSSEHVSASAYLYCYGPDAAVHADRWRAAWG